MARSNQAAEFSSFVGGLVTEASPLTFPPNACLDLQNFVINKDGSLRRRLGIDLEADHVVRDTTQLPLDGWTPVMSTFTWENAGGLAGVRLQVVQAGKEVFIYDSFAEPLSSGLLYNFTIADADARKYFGFASVDGLLIIATGRPALETLEYKDGQFNRDYFRLKVRDVFGVQYVKDGVDYRLPENISKRIPAEENEVDTRHLYNLRNSTWGPLRMPLNDEYGEDPIYSFRLNAGFVSWFQRNYSGDILKGRPFPSYADNLTTALYPDPNDGGDRFGDRFWPNVLLNSPTGNFEVPYGYFVIDLLDRGASRVERLNALHAESDKYDNFVVDTSVIPTDRTPGGATCVAEFAGRIFYAGFSGELIDGDRHSPRLSSYIMYSQLVEDPSDLANCYQAGDPTSKDNNELLDTDGGFIRIDGAYNIKSLVNIGESLIILAENGVWALLGGSDYGFTATDNRIVKITEFGIAGAKTAVVMDNTIMYWASQAIMHIAPDQFGKLTAINLTNTTIQKLYDKIPLSDKMGAQGIYDSYERKVRWVYGNAVGSDIDSKELVLDITLGSFYYNVFKDTSAGRPNVVAPFEVPPYRIAETTYNVVVGSDSVLSDINTVQTTSSLGVDGVRETKYLTAVGTGQVLSFTFSEFNRDDFKDWVSYDNVGVDSDAYILTGYISDGDHQRSSQVPYVTFHFKRTETGFEEVNGDLVPKNQSSCLVQAQWDWTNSVNSGRWGREFQAYRYKRFYMPTNVNDPYDTGFSTVVTKNKLRGKGKVVSLKLSAEAGKDCQLLGWSMLISKGSSV